jgi:hypothetical protein
VDREGRQTAVMTRAFLEAIGAVTVEFASLESHIQFAIWSLLVGTKLEDQAFGQIVTADLSYRKRLEMLEALLKHKFPERDNADFRQLKPRLYKVEEERNAIVHSIWGSSPEPNNVTRIKTTAKGELKTKFHQLSLDGIRAIATRIYSATEDLANFHLDLLEPGHARVSLHGGPKWRRK